MFHNDDSDDAHLDLGILRHAASFRAASLTIISIDAVCRQYVIRQSKEESIMWHVTAHGSDGDVGR